MKRVYIIVCGALVLCAAILFVYWLNQDKGSLDFFEDQWYNLQALRSLDHIHYGGADTGEFLKTIRSIRAGDNQGWFEAWNQTAQRVEALAERLHDPVSKGKAYLRSYNYYRTAEFILHPDHNKRLECFQKSVDTFRLGLKWLGVKHDFIDVPYGRNKLKATYYPGTTGAEDKPLLIIGGGLDSTQEELYFLVGAAALERGYSVLTYSGPGQGAVLREQGLTFTHEWEKPLSAVLNAYFTRYSKPRKIVLIGVSMGGYLAPRAAAFEDRIDGVVAFDVLFDLREAIESMIKRVPSNHPFYRWSFAYNNWAFGVRGDQEPLNLLRSYNLMEIAQRITCDVLILAGENDFFIPIKQAEDFKRSLINARSITTRIYTPETGGDEHCQVGYRELCYGDLFDWIADKFCP